ALKRSVRAKFLNSETSQLLIPGTRKTSRGALPQVPCGGKAKAAVLRFLSKVRSSLGRTGLAIMLGREASVGEPDQLLAFPDVSCIVEPVGAGLMKVVIPGTGQTSRVD